MKIWLVSDTHFNHTNIIGYCNRPYTSAAEMNADLIKRWNNTVGKEDHVFHLGDFGFGPADKLKGFMESLHGTITLIRGNHDRKAKWWMNQDIYNLVEVSNHPIIVEDYVLSHHPLSNLMQSNIHGHIHNNPAGMMEYQEPLHYNVSIDVTDYKPILFDDIKERMHNV